MNTSTNERIAAFPKLVGPDLAGTFKTAFTSAMEADEPTLLQQLIGVTSAKEFATALAGVVVKQHNAETTGRRMYVRTKESNPAKELWNKWKDTLYDPEFLQMLDELLGIGEFDTFISHFAQSLVSATYEHSYVGPQRDYLERAALELLNDRPVLALKKKRDDDDGNSGAPAGLRPWASNALSAAKARANKVRSPWWGHA